MKRKDRARLKQLITKNLDRAIELSGRDKFERTPCFIGSEAHIESLLRSIDVFVGRTNK